MRARFVTCGWLVAAGLLLVQTALAQEQQEKPRPAGAQPQAQPAEKPGQAPQMSPEEEEMMKAYMEAGAPGPEHERFKKFVGKWDIETTWRSAPDAEPMHSKGQAQFDLLYGGRFLRQDFKSDMLGQPVEGIGFEGFNKLRQQYESVWIESTGTPIFMMTGKAGPEGAVTYTAKADDPLTGERDVPVRAVVRWVGDDKMVWEMFVKPEGKPEFKTGEMTYTRRQ